jgi:hypothetical protein
VCRRKARAVQSVGVHGPAPTMSVPYHMIIFVGLGLLGGASVGFKAAYEMRVERKVCCASV